MKKFKIVLVSQEYPPETGWGGIGTYTWNLAHALSDLDYPVTVLALNSTSKPSFRKDANIEIIRLAHPPRLFFRTSLGTIIYSMQVAYRILKISKHSSIPLVIEAPEWFAEAYIFSKLRKKCSLVVKLHTPHFVTSHLNGLKQWKIMNHLEMQTVKNANAIHAPCKAIAKIVGDEWGFELSKVDILPYPVDTKIYSPVSDPAGKESKFILFAGRLERRKGVYDIAECIPEILKQNQDVLFVFIGKDMNDSDGNSNKVKLLRQLDSIDCSSRVKFLDHMNRMELATWFQRAYITLVPSLWENFPNTCLEAMSCGSLVIASDVGGIPEIIDNRVDGVLIPPGSPQALIENVSYYLHNENERDTIAYNAAKKIRKNFNFPKIAQEVISRYSNLIDNR